MQSIMLEKQLTCFRKQSDNLLEKNKNVNSLLFSPLGVSVMACDLEHITNVLDNL